jgi:hypothetical protein
LSRLSSVEGLKIPDSFRGRIYFGFLNEQKKEKLRKKYPDVIIE